MKIYDVYRTDRIDYDEYNAFNLLIKDKAFGGETIKDIWGGVTPSIDEIVIDCVGTYEGDSVAPYILLESFNAG